MGQLGSQLVGHLVSRSVGRLDLLLTSCGIEPFIEDLHSTADPPFRIKTTHWKNVDIKIYIAMITLDISKLKVFHDIDPSLTKDRH